MTGWVARWRLALRIARRDALRHRGRTLLVLAMVGLPVLAVVGADTVARTADISPVEALPGQLGAADARLTGVAREQVWADPLTGDPYGGGAPADPAWTLADVVAALPAGSTVQEVVSGRLGYRTATGRGTADAYADDLTDPLRTGAVDLLGGRLPSAAGELAVTRDLADRGLDLGAELTVGPDDVPARVVGIVRSAARGIFLVLPPVDADLLTETGTEFYAAVPGGLDWATVQQLNGQGLVVLSRQVVTDPPPPGAGAPPGQDVQATGPNSAEVAVLSLVVVAVVLQVVLLAGPAFAVGVRRQRRDLALIAATGGAPGDLRRIVLASAVVLGAGAALLGAAAGIGLAGLLVAALDRWTALPFGPFDVAPVDVLGIAAVGVLAALLAAYVPAAQAGRTDVVATLTGRRGQLRTSWQLPVLGGVLVAAGLVLVVLGGQGAGSGVAGGTVLLVLGVVSAGPWLVGLLAPLARWLPVSGRIAVRDAVRHRSRTAPAVAAVMATVAAVTALAIGGTSDTAQDRRDYVPSAAAGTGVVTGFDVDQQAWTDLAAAIGQQTPDRPVHQVLGVPFTLGAGQELLVATPGCAGEAVHCRWYPAGVSVGPPTRGDLIVTDPETADVLSGAPLPAAAHQALAAGRVVVFGAGALDAQGQVTVLAAEYDGVGATTTLGTVALPATEVSPPSRYAPVPALVIVPSALAGRLPVPAETVALVVGGPDDPVTRAQEDDVQEVAATLSSSLGIQVERGWQNDLTLPLALLTGVGAFLVLVATLTATGLALADARPDLATLAAIGAAPRTRRRIAMGTAAVVGGAGALLGLLVGLGPGIAITWPLTADVVQDGVASGHVLEMPWLVLGALVLAVPLLAVAVTGLSVRSRLPMDRRIS